MQVDLIEEALDGTGLVARWKGAELKTLDEESRAFEAVLSNAQPDRDQEIVDQKALQKVLSPSLPIPVLYNHSIKSGAIGKTLRSWGDETQTHVAGVIGKGFDIVYDGALLSVDSLWKQIQQRILATMSYGFFSKRIDMRNGFFGLHPTDVFETTFATIPANAGARLEVVKSMVERRSIVAEDKVDREVYSEVARRIALMRLKLIR